MAQESETLDRLARADARGLFGRIARGLASQLTLLSASILRNLLIVPFFISAHGVAGFADWVKLLAAAGIASLVTCGQSLYYGYQIRTCRAARDHAGMNRALADGNAFFLRLGVGVSLVLVLAPVLIDPNALLNLGVLSPTEAHLTFAALVISLVGQQYREMLRAVYIAHGELMRNDLAMALANIALGGLVIAVLLLGGAIATVALLHALVIPGAVCAAAFLDFRRYAEVAPGVTWRGADFGRTRLRSLVAHSVPQVTERILLNGPTVALGVVGVAPASVVQFNLLRTAARLMRGGRFAMVFSVEMTRQRTQRDARGFRRLHRRGALVMGLFGGGMAGGMLALWDLFLPFWTNGAMTADTTLLALMVAEMAVVAFGMHSATLLRFGGRIGDLARAQSAGAVFFLAVAVPALVFGGLYAMLGVMVLGAALFAYLAPAWYAHRQLDAPLLAGLGGPPASGLTAGLAAYGLAMAGRGLLGL